MEGYHYGYLNRVITMDIYHYGGYVLLCSLWRLRFIPGNYLFQVPHHCSFIVSITGLVYSAMLWYVQEHLYAIS